MTTAPSISFLEIKYYRIHSESAIQFIDFFVFYRIGIEILMWICQIVWLCHHVSISLKKIYIQKPFFCLGRIWWNYWKLQSFRTFLERVWFLKKNKMIYFFHCLSKRQKHVIYFFSKIKLCQRYNGHQDFFQLEIWTKAIPTTIGRRTWDGSRSVETSIDATSITVIRS